MKIGDKIKDSKGNIFTPAGHTWLEGWTWEGDKFVERVLWYRE